MKKRPKLFELLTTNVAGIEHHVKVGDLEGLREGEYMALVREPENPYDPNAIRVDARKDDWPGIKKIGYVPKVLAQMLALLMDNGYKLKARISHVNPRKGLVMMEICMRSKVEKPVNASDLSSALEKSASQIKKEKQKKKRLENELAQIASQKPY